MSGDVSCGEDITLFQKGEIIGLHQAKKTSKEFDEITGTGLRTVQRIFKTWKDSGELSTSWKKWGRKKILNDGDGSTVELTAMSNSESKSISTSTM